MQLNFEQVHNELSLYFMQLSGLECEDAFIKEDTRCAKLIANDLLWSSVLKQPPELTLFSNSLKSKHPHLLVFGALSEALIERLFPVKRIFSNHPSFLHYFKIWFIKQWLSQYAVNQYDNDFCSVIELVTRVFKPYDKHAGDAFDEVIAGFEFHFQQAIQIQVGVSQLQSQLIEVLKVFEQKSDRVKSQTIQREIEQAKTDQTTQSAAQLIRQNVAGKSAPHWAVPFICKHWLEYFRRQQSEKGSKKAMWWGQTLLKDLVESFYFTPQSSATEAQQSYFSSLRKNIKQLLIKTECEKFAMDSFLSQLAMSHENLLQGIPVNFHWLSFNSELKDKVPCEGLSESQRRTLLARFKPGMWMSYVKAGDTIQCRVAHRDFERSLIILVNYSGAKIDVLNATAIDQATRQNQLQLLDISSQLNCALEKMNRDIAVQRKTLKCQQDKKRAQEQHQKEMAEQERERLAVLARQQREFELQQLKQKVSELRPGVSFRWMEMPHEALQFVLRLKVSGQYVFADKRGNKVACWTEDELAELWVDGELEYLDENSSLGANVLNLEQIVSVQRTQKLSR